MKKVLMLTFATILFATLLFKNVQLSNEIDELKQSIEHMASIDQQSKKTATKQTGNANQEAILLKGKRQKAGARNNEAVNVQPDSISTAAVSQEDFAKELYDAVDKMELPAAPTTNSEIESQFNEGEEIDHAWAYEQELNIREFIDNHIKDGFDLHNVHCKSTKCVVSLYSTEENAIFLGAMFTETLGKQSWRENNNNVTFDPRVVNGKINIHVGRYEATFN